MTRGLASAGIFAVLAFTLVGQAFAVSGVSDNDAALRAMMDDRPHRPAPAAAPAAPAPAAEETAPPTAAPQQAEEAALPQSDASQAAPKRHPRRERLRLRKRVLLRERVRLRPRGKWRLRPRKLPLRQKPLQPRQKLLLGRQLAKAGLRRCCRVSSGAEARRRATRLLKHPLLLRAVTRLPRRSRRLANRRRRPKPARLLLKRVQVPVLKKRLPRQRLLTKVVSMRLSLRRKLKRVRPLLFQKRLLRRVRVAVAG